MNEMNNGVAQSTGKKGYLIVIFLLILVILGLGGFIAYDHRDALGKKEEKNTVSDVEKKDAEENNAPVSKTETVTLDKKVVNEKLSDFSFAYLFSYGKNRYPDRIKYNQELLHGDKEKMFDFVWTYAYLLKITPSIVDEDANGEEVTGAYAVGVDAFSTLYKQLLGVSYDGNYSVSHQYSFALKNNYLYGGMYTGIGEEGILLKINDCQKTEDVYNVVVDVLYFDISDEKQFQALSDYSSPSVVDYPKEYVAYQLKISAIQNGDLYTIQSMKAVKV